MIVFLDNTFSLSDQGKVRPHSRLAVPFRRRKGWLGAGLCGVALFTVGMVCASLSM